MSDLFYDVGGELRLHGTLVGPAGNVSSVFARQGDVVGANGDYYGILANPLTGATLASRYVGATASGAPVAGTFAIGDFVVDRSGAIWICVTAGTPGTWSSTSGSSVASVTAADTSIVIGGTATNPTVRTNTLDVIAAQHPAAANWSNNSKKITSLGAASASTDAASLANTLDQFAAPAANVAWNSKK